MGGKENAGALGIGDLIAEVAVILKKTPDEVADMTMTQIGIVLSASERISAAQARLDLQVVHVAAAALFPKGGSSFTKFAASLKAGAEGKSLDSALESRRQLVRRTKESGKRK